MVRGSGLLGAQSSARPVRAPGTFLVTAAVARGMAVGIVAILFWVPTTNCLVLGAAPGQPCFDARPDYIQHIFYLHVLIAHVAYLPFGIALIARSPT